MFPFKNWPNTLLIQAQNNASNVEIINCYSESLVKNKDINQENLINDFDINKYHDIIVVDFYKENVEQTRIDDFFKQALIPPIEDLNLKILIIVGIEHMNSSNSIKLVNLIENSSSNIYFLFITYHYHAVNPIIISNSTLFNWNHVKVQKPSEHNEFKEFLNFLNISFESHKSYINDDKYKELFLYSKTLHRNMLHQDAIHKDIVNIFIEMDYKLIIFLLDIFIFLEKDESKVKKLFLLQKSANIKLNKKLIFMYLNMIMNDKK